METIFRLCTLVFLTVIVLNGLKMVYFNRLFESSGLRISMLWPSLAIPLGASLIWVYTLRDLLRDGYRLLAWPEPKLAEEDTRQSTAKFRPPQ
jgi:TRAP-type C4-dicarboxylate transport system permease small subunit